MSAIQQMLLAGGGVSGPPAVTWNVADKNTDITLTSGNLIATLTGSNGSLRSVRATQGRSSGVHSYSVTSSAGAFKMVGLATAVPSLAGTFYPGSDTESYGYEQSAGNKYRGGSPGGYGASYTSGDVIVCEVDFTAATITFYKNGVSQGVAFSSITAGTYYPCVGIPNNGGQWTADFTLW